MAKAELLIDEFEWIRDVMHPAVNGLSVDELTYRPDDQSNSISWLAWHLTRVQDAAVSSLSEGPEVWIDSGWFDRFALALDPSDTGYGHDPVIVGSVTSSAAYLLGYFEDVHRRTVEWLRSLDDTTLAVVLDDSLVRPLTVESKLVGVIVDDLQHVGQIAYLRGIVQHASL